MKGRLKSAYHKFLNTAVQDIRFQFMCPTKSITGYVVTRMETNATKPIYKNLIRHMDIRPDQKILEIGFGRGTGIEMALERIAGGKGHIYGTEISEYMKDIAFHEINNPRRVSIMHNYSELQTFLSFPDNTFDAIFHVDVFYAWDRQSMREICAEMYRVLKPNCPVYCCMELERLRKLAAYRILSESDFHPMRYIEGIEQCSFDDIKVQYLRINSNGDPCESDQQQQKGLRELQMITARKPKDESFEKLDADRIWAELEADIRAAEAVENAAKSTTGKPKKMAEELDDMKFKKNVKDSST